MKKKALILLAAITALFVAPPAFAETVTAKLADCSVRVAGIFVYSGEGYLSNFEAMRISLGQETHAKNYEYFTKHFTEEGLEFKNESMEYPILSYKNITYFPLVNEYTRALDIVCQWYDGKLYVSYAPKYFDVPRNLIDDARHEESPVCTVAEYPVYINNKLFDNQSTEYPILNYNGVSYIPFTWEFMRDEFNMKQKYKDSYFHDGNMCLYINSYKEAGVSKVTPRFNAAYRNDGSSVRYKILTDYDYPMLTGTSPVTYTYGIFYFNKSKLIIQEGEIEEEQYLGYDHRRGNEMSKSVKAEYSDGKLYYDGQLLTELDSETMAKMEKIDEETKAKRANSDGESFYAESSASAGGEILGISVFGETYDVQRDIVKYLFLNRDGKYIPIDCDGTSTPSQVVIDGDLIYANLGAGGITEIHPDGSTKTYSDSDHEIYNPVGIIDGKLLFEALWSLDNLSLVNDGFFTLEADGSFKRYMPYAHNDGAFVLDNKLYIVRDDLCCFVDTTNGEKICYLVK